MRAFATGHRRRTGDAKAVGISAKACRGRIVAEAERRKGAGMLLW